MYVHINATVRILLSPVGQGTRKTMLTAIEHAFVLKGKYVYFVDCWHKISMCKHLL